MEEDIIYTLSGAIVAVLNHLFPSDFVILSMIGSELWVKYKECDENLECLAEFLRSAKSPTE